jgi:uncharacterized membrane protein (Fun14 family)
MLGFRGKQLAATVANSVLGLLVGVSLSPLVFGAMVGLTFEIARKHDTNAALLCAGVTTLLVWLLAWNGVMSAARDAAKRFPIALRAVPIAIMVGAGIACVTWLAMALRWRDSMGLALAASVLAGSALQAIAAMRGSRAGVRERHGGPQRGVGDMCAECMYDLRGIDAGKACPECGGEMRFAQYVES